jgi:Uma2 family endonuclease
MEGLRWSPTGRLQPSYIPDVSVLDRRSVARPAGVLSLDPPPLVVVDVLSPESRRRDPGEKAAGYFAGVAVWRTGRWRYPSSPTSMS